MAAQPTQKRPLLDRDAVANCMASGQNGKTGRTLPESADDRGSKINDSEEGGQQ